MSDVILSESEVENIIRKFLKKLGFIVKKRVKKQGIDIEALSKSGEEFYFEVEGSKKPNGKPLTTSQLYTHFHRCIGQICRRANKTSRCFVVLPKHNTYLKYSREMGEARKRLRIPFIFIENKDKLYILKPNSKQLVKFSKF